MILQMGNKVYAISDDNGERGDEVEYGNVATFAPEGTDDVYIAHITDPNDDSQFKIYRSDVATFPDFSPVATTDQDAEFDDDDEDEDEIVEGEEEEEPEDE